MRRIGDAVIGRHKLLEMVAQAGLSRPGQPHNEYWHRDIAVLPSTPPNIRYLWLLFALDDFTADNGSTWVVPGSQRMLLVEEPTQPSATEQYPSRVQILAKAGDLVLLNPSTLHQWGHNDSDKPRRMINVALAHRDAYIRRDHWSLAGPAIQAQASQRLRELLQSFPPPSRCWEALPEGWINDGGPPDSVEYVPEEQERQARPTTDSAAEAEDFAPDK